MKAAHAAGEQKHAASAALPPNVQSQALLQWDQAHDDAPLNPQIVVLIQPHLNLLSTLQEPKNQVLHAGEQEWAGSGQHQAVPSAK